MGACAPSFRTPRHYVTTTYCTSRFVFLIISGTSYAHHPSNTRHAATRRLFRAPAGQHSSTLSEVCDNTGAFHGPHWSNFSIHLSCTLKTREEHNDSVILIMLVFACWTKKKMAQYQPAEWQWCFFCILRPRAERGRLGPNGYAPSNEPFTLQRHGRCLCDPLLAIRRVEGLLLVECANDTAVFAWSTWLGWLHEWV